MFSGFIWASIFDYHHEILEELNTQYTVNYFYIYDFKNNNNFYQNAILKIYTTDDINLIKVKNVKLKHLQPYDKKFVYFLFDIKDPKYRIKQGYNTKISTIVEDLKKNIRNKYKHKVSNYVHDITIHMSDNSIQTLQLNKIMNNLNKFQTQEFVNLKHFLKMQFKPNFPLGIFTRVDMLVRKYSIQEYLKNENYDFSLYNKMQKLRGTHSTHNHHRFKELINSLVKNNFDFSNEIEYKYNHILIDGSHRLSYCYLNKLPFISVKTTRNKKIPNYDINWFKNKFTKEEIEILNNEIKILNDFLNK